jgi:amino acid adenylation domain-containing protein
MNSQALAEPSVRTFLGGFHDQVRLRPDAPAVSQAGFTLTYRQLDRRSNAIARHLAALGIGQEKLVALLLDRGPEMILALLGILKAGAAYVPLDPAFPDARLSFMVEDAQPSAVITDSHLLNKLPADARTVCLDRDAAAIDAQATDAHDLPISSRAPWTRAYVIYTSGSTGVPKGVEITHGSVMNLLESFRDRPGLGEDDVVLAHTTLSFDIAVIELWLPLLTGAHILLAPPGRGTDARLIADLLAGAALPARADLMAGDRITFLQATPSLWRLLLEAGWRDGQGLTALSGGEPLSRELADALLATGADVWNVYGPTETTVWSSLWHVADTGPILIGHPIRDTELLVLDDRLQPVREGESGELCIGGSGLARGYLNRPALTAEKFPPHPFNPTSGSRIYRTGDLARSRGEAGLECLGRIDNQLKVDGFRIEPEEIEAVLSTHPDVQQAIVTAVERTPGDRRLVAYIVHGSLPEPDVDDLRALARQRLPSYMVPAVFIMLRKAPLTPNGKIDRRALPPPDTRSSPTTGQVRAPWTPLERRLADMWREVLGIDRVGAEDNFFDVGGRSRLGAQLFARIETELGRRLPLATLFTAPTIASLAEAIEQCEPSAPWECLVPIRTSGSAAPLFCIHPVGGNVLAYRDLVKRLGPTVPCYGLQAVGLDGTTPPLPSVEAMAERYVQEIRALLPHGPYHLCGFSFGGLVAFEMARRLANQHAPVGLLALIDTEFPDRPASPAFEWLAASGSLSRRAYRLLQRARRHARTLGRVGLAGYLRTIVQSPLSKRSQPVAQPLAENPVLHAERVRRANTRAAIDYVPTRYDGSMLYFRANHPGALRDRRGLWSRLAASVEILDVEGGHSDLRLEPQVQIVAGELRARLGTAAK